MSNKNEEFKPNVIEPIEGQMRYDELLVHQKEEPKEEVFSHVDGQIDMWSMPAQKSSTKAQAKKKSESLKNEEADAESDKEETEESGNGSNGTGGGGTYGGDGVLFKPLEEVLHDSMIP